MHYPSCGLDTFKMIALATGLMISIAAVGIPADDASAATATAATTSADATTGTAAGSPATAPAANQDSPPPDEAGYKKAREQLDRLYAGLDVISSKMDRSLFEIDALSEHLGSDPAAIFHFVRDEIRYEPYAGVLRSRLSGDRHGADIRWARRGLEARSAGSSTRGSGARAQGSIA